MCKWYQWWAPGTICDGSVSAFLSPADMPQLLPGHRLLVKGEFKMLLTTFHIHVSSDPSLDCCPQVCSGLYYCCTMNYAVVTHYPLAGAPWARHLALPFTDCWQFALFMWEAMYTRRDRGWQMLGAGREEWQSCSSFKAWVVLAHREGMHHLIAPLKPLLKPSLDLPAICRMLSSFH